MTQSRLSDLIAKKKAGEISPSELIELNALLKESEQARQTLDKVDAFWNIPLESDYAGDAYLNNKWAALSNRLFQPPVVQLPAKRGMVRSLAKWLSAAACIALIAAGSIVWWNFSRMKEVARQNTVSTKNGSRSKVGLPDGTQVWLNAGSQLTYNDSFGKELREVRLVGEAYFDVVKDAEHPFVIHANEMNIKVLGTAFNVRAYPDDKRTEAALIRGLIEVSFNGRPSDRLLLKPNEKISVMNGEMLKTEQTGNAPVTAGNVREHNRSDEPLISFSKIAYESARDSTVLETAWIKNKLIFRNKDFAELLKDMERWFNVNIQCQDAALLEQHFTGSFYHESITDALDILRLSYPFHYKMDKSQNTVVIQ